MAYRQIGQLVEHDGKLSQYRGGRIEWDGTKAWDVAQLAVSRMRMADDDGPIALHQRLVGCVPMGGNWSGYVRVDWGDIFVDLAGAELVDVRTEIKQPRNSRNFTWKWDTSRREWVKSLWDRRCQECYGYHNPEHKECQGCGRCHRLGGSCERGR